MRPDGDRQLERVRGFGRELRKVPQDLLDRAGRVGDVAREDRSRVDRPELERRDDAEVAAAAPQRPQEVGVAVGTGDDLLAGGRDDLGPDEVVAGEPLEPGQPADPATKRQTGHARVAERAADDGQVVLPGGRVDVVPQRAAGGPDRPARRVDRDLASVAEVHDQGALGHGVAGDPVATAPDRDRQAEIGGRDDGSDDVVVRACPDDDRRPPLDRRVEGGPDHVIVDVGRGDDAVEEPFSQSVDDEPFHVPSRAPAAKTSDL